MIYEPETYYFEQDGFSFDKAFLVTAKVVSKFCNGYASEILVPKKGISLKKVSDYLPYDQTEKEELIEKTYSWNKTNSEVSELFAMFLYDKYPDMPNDVVAKFDHHDNTSCWALNLSDEEFVEVQKTWQENNLPIDLFYPNDKAVQKGTKYYTPKEWEQEIKD